MIILEQQNQFQKSVQDITDDIVPFVSLFNLILRDAAMTKDLK